MTWQLGSNGWDERQPINTNTTQDSNMVKMKGTEADLKRDWMQDIITWETTEICDIRACDDLECGKTHSKENKNVRENDDK